MQMDDMRRGGGAGVADRGRTRLERQKSPAAHVTPSLCRPASPCVTPRHPASPASRPRSGAVRAVCVFATRVVSSLLSPLPSDLAVLSVLSAALAAILDSALDPPPRPGSARLAACPRRPPWSASSFPKWARTPTLKPSLPQ